MVESSGFRKEFSKRDQNRKTSSLRSSGGLPHGYRGWGRDKASLGLPIFAYWKEWAGPKRKGLKPGCRTLFGGGGEA